MAWTIPKAIEKEQQPVDKVLKKIWMVCPPGTEEAPDDFHCHRVGSPRVEPNPRRYDYPSEKTTMWT